jgi:hypothetical protein
MEPKLRKPGIAHLQVPGFYKLHYPYCSGLTDTI